MNPADLARQERRFRAARVGGAVTTWRDNTPDAGVITLGANTHELLVALMSAPPWRQRRRAVRQRPVSGS